MVEVLRRFKVKRSEHYAALAEELMHMLTKQVVKKLVFQLNYLEVVI